MCGDGARRLEGSLGQERSDAPRILAFPGPELDEVRGREHEFHAPAGSAREHQPPSEKRFERRRDGGHNQQAPRLRDTVEKLDAGRGQPRGISEIGELDERPGGLRWGIDAFSRVDSYPQASNEGVEFSGG
jgi:hypothetical protein